jgi:hypothetical protein
MGCRDEQCCVAADPATLLVTAQGHDDWANLIAFGVGHNTVTVTWFNPCQEHLLKEPTVAHKVALQPSFVSLLVYNCSSPADPFKPWDSTPCSCSTTMPSMHIGASHPFSRLFYSLTVRY